MSKYEELKGRIEALDDGWNKEADDIARELQESFGTQQRYISIPLATDNLEIQTSERTKVASFSAGNTSCEKNTAFKQALLWLLNNSDISKEDKKNQGKRDKIQAQLDKLQGELNELK